MQVKSLGLSVPYQKDPGSHSVIKKILSLPYLPSEQIPATFDLIRNGVSAAPLNSLLDYVQDNWIVSSVFPPSSWSTFYRFIRTNNDVEGWQHRLNSKCPANANLYVLVQQLQEEAKVVNLQLVLVSEEACTRNHRQRASKKNANLFKAWDMYKDGLITVKEMFESVRGK